MRARLPANFEDVFEARGHHQDQAPAFSLKDGALVPIVVPRTSSRAARSISKRAAGIKRDAHESGDCIATLSEIVESWVIFR